MVKVQIINGNTRQIVLDTKGKNDPKDIYVIGLKEHIILEVEEKLLKKIISELPKGAQINILK
jgi:hypothetical protein